MFDKLHDFFSRYFSESGSIYFRHTAPHHNVYERVYTDDRDVMLFWKTHMLYYVKTDRLFNSLAVEVGGEQFFFDVSELKHKQSNEKRDLVYTFVKREKDGRLVFSVAYSEKGTKTKLDDVLGAIKQAAGVPIDEDTLQKAFRVFEKQSEVDYFINKNARAFLQEQFDLWMYQYLFKGESAFNEVRLKQLQALRDIAFKIIDFIAQFEDELVKIWNKPKFVRNSHYIITLDKIIERDEALLASIFQHEGMQAQMAEWRALGMLGDDTPDSPAELLAWIEVNKPDETPLHPHLRFLPLDTRHVADRELDILALFDDLDVALDGWLVHSENYQALNTLTPKFSEVVDVIYTDPPYNTSASEIIYVNSYKDSSWLTLLEDRLRAAKLLLSEDGILCQA
jgi:hypothetical protein